MSEIGVKSTQTAEEKMLMMGGRSWDDWIEEYSHSHENRINRIAHSFGIPMIALAILMVPFCFFVTNLWMVALGLFVVGWILQFIGHYFEGKPPEFFKDYRFLFVGLRWWFKKVVGVGAGSSEKLKTEK